MNDSHQVTDQNRKEEATSKVLPLVQPRELTAEEVRAVAGGPTIDNQT